MKKIIYIIFIVTAIFSIWHCGGDPENPSCPNCPCISSIEPPEAAPGDTVTIHGVNFDRFGDSTDLGTVMIGGEQATFTGKFTSTEIHIEIPGNIEPGELEVEVCALNINQSKNNFLCSTDASCMQNTIKVNLKVIVFQTQKYAVQRPGSWQLGCQLPNNHYILISHDLNSLLGIEFSDEGDELNSFSFPFQVLPEDILPTDDNGFIILGNENVNGAGDNIFTVKFSSMKDEPDWFIQYQNPWHEFACNIIQSKNGGFYISGHEDRADLSGDIDVFVIKVNEFGQASFSEWGEDLGLPLEVPGQQFGFCEVYDISDTLYVLSRSFGGIDLYKIPQKELNSWFSIKSIGEDINDAVLIENVFHVVSSKNRGSNRDIVLSKFDLNGNRIAGDEIFGGFKDDSPKFISYNALSETYIIGGGRSENDGYVIVSSKNFAFKEKYNTQNTNEGIEHAFPTNDGGFFISCFYKDSIYAIKTDSNLTGF